MAPASHTRRAIAHSQEPLASGSAPVPTEHTRRSKRRYVRRKLPPMSPIGSDYEDEKPPMEDKVEVDRLSALSPELLAMILAHVSPADSPDSHSLFSMLRLSKALLPHVKTHLYRHLRVDTRVHAHAMHRTLHGNEHNALVKAITADVNTMAKTSSQWLGWFLFHSMHSLCGIIGSCRKMIHLTLLLPEASSAWANSLTSALFELKMLQSITKDLEPSNPHGPEDERGPGSREKMDIGWRHRDSFAMWSLNQFMKPLSTLKALTALRLCGMSSDSSTVPSQPHSVKIREMVLLEVNITNSDFLALIGTSQAVRKLTIWRSSLLSKRGLGHVVKKCPNLVELRVGGSWFGAKDEDDNCFPLDAAIHLLPHLRLMHVSGALVSPKILLDPSTNLDHLLVTNSPSWTPQATHAALCKMTSEPVPSVKRLTLPEMDSHGPPDGAWNDKWRFTIAACAKAKGVILDFAQDEDDDSNSSASD